MYKMEKKYLIQRISSYDDEHFVSLMSENELINYIDMDDCHNETYNIFDVSEFGKIKELHYVGWQPVCLIELKDEDGNIVVSGYGTDH